MGEAARKLEEEKPRIRSFEFMVLDDTFTDPKTGDKIPVEFSFEGIHYGLANGVTYNAENLPGGTDIDALVHHLNTRPGYPVHKYVDVFNDEGVAVGKKSIQSGWRPRFKCVNMR